jgi:rubrerythrin
MLCTEDCFIKEKNKMQKKVLKCEKCGRIYSMNENIKDCPHCNVLLIEREEEVKENQVNRILNG